MFGGLSSINQPFFLSQEPDLLLRQVGLDRDQTITLSLHAALGHTLDFKDRTKRGTKRKSKKREHLKAFESSKSGQW